MPSSNSKNAIVIGATSGIGWSLALVLAHNGYRVGITGRRRHLLDELQKKIGDDCFVQEMDVTNPQAKEQLNDLISKMGNVGLIIYNSGVGYQNPELDLTKEMKIVATNVEGFTLLSNLAMEHFIGNNSGHLVGISSIAAIRGNRKAPAYFASKSFMSSYLQGLQQLVTHKNLPITVTDIKPGFVDTPMIDARRAYWVCSADKAAEQIYGAIRDKKKHAYITPRWRLVAWVLKCLPNFIFNRF
ncbi:MAG: SDR family NAD(P)-dependent oxidoreductase [Candidatus Nitronauta litoralis]|uniref:SDR family NAD(P)-dependent oxidoreductase n=1 Tax=Candidatus Nitronauta litoralis TaxID=2705533 RepID=A0A7T0BW80_9BACT|nr:MAG: SDR family NAD(P)-dependent oxidoreductase [Candidatus Nitronauta litoralis]